MKKIYKLSDGDWEWDDEELKWVNLGKPPKTIEEAKQKKLNFIVDGATWKQVLYGIFISNREFPNWQGLRELYDEEDQSYFDVLENHYKSGKMKTEIYLEETNGHSEIDAGGSQKMENGVAE